jgi:S1-C subfamily serine protease
MKYLLAGLAFLIGLSSTAFAASTDTLVLNRMIDQTNFIVGTGCSGTLISLEHRLILTNNHCIRGNVRKIKRSVTGPDGVVKQIEVEKRLPVTVQQKDYRRYQEVGSISYKTDIVAFEADKDLAILQIISEKVRSVMAAPLLPGNQKIVRGESVFVVGNPAGLDATVTSGIVSSTNRQFPVPWAEDKVSFVQIDAPVNGGNSGGSLYNADLHLIGVPAAKLRGSDGLALAIPIDSIREFLEDNCYAEVYDSDAESFAACTAAKEDDEDGSSETSE